MMKRLLFVLGFLFAAGLTALAQNTVSGLVTDANTGEPLQGVAVLAKGTTVGAFTQADGSFKLELPEGVNTLVLSFVGYQRTEVDIAGRSVLNISIQPEDLVLDEVIIVGYGTQIKRELTGNIAKVDGADINQIPVPSVEQALQGRTAGVFVEAINGKPGGTIRMRVRGASSIGASNQPLFVVDGIPITNVSQNTSGGPINPLSDLNFNDVESIEILKDASAAAIYGSRAANGVVIITTKKGKQGKTQFNVNLQTGFSKPTGFREFLNAEEYVQLFTQTAIGGGKFDYANNPDDWTDEQEAIDWYVGFVEARFDRYSGHSDWRTNETDTDWQELAFQDAQLTQADFSASGGNDKTRFYTSVAYSNQDGILIGNGFERMSGRLNLDHSANEWLDFGIQMALSRTQLDQVSNDNAFSTPLQLIAQAPITPPRNPEGELYDRPTAVYYNGLIENEDTQRDIVTFRNLTNGYIGLKLLPGLTARGEVGVDLYTLRQNTFWGSRTFGGQATNGQGNSRLSQVVNFTSKAYLNYNKNLADAHNLDVTAGVEFQKSTTNITEVTGTEFPVDDLKTVASAAEITFGSSSLTQFSFISYFGRLNYNFNRRYLLSLSARVDGSSRFGANNRYGLFPAASAGWVLTEEGFLKDNNLLSFLKLRASYGVIGNAEIGNFQHLGLYGAVGYNGVSGLAPTQIPNPDLTWETTQQLDVGIDFGLFKDRITGEIDYYVKNTSDLLLDVPVPGTSGFRTQTQNIGEISNKGFEFVVNSNNLVGEFSWTTSLNLAINNNEVVSLAEGQDIIDPGSSRLMNVVKVGEPIGVFWGAEYAGVDPNNGDALWYVNTKDADGNIIDETTTTNNFSEAEFVALGDPNPDLIAGMNNTFSFKGLELNVMLQGVWGNQIHNAAGGFMSCQACWFDNQTKDQLRAWKQPGDVTDVPEARFFWGNGDQSRSSRYLSEGSYLRVKTATLSYSLPNSMLNSTGLTKVRIYISGQNLFTFTDYDGWDPEVTTDAFVTNVRAGVDFYAAPQPKTFTVGLNVGF